jgi:hypothetical protein
MSTSTRVRPSPLSQLPGHLIAYYPAIVPQVGSVNAAVLLCQLVYWTPRAKDAQGWVYKTQLELMQETGLSRHEQRKARDMLKARGLLEEHYDRLEHQLYVRINVEAYNAMVADCCDQANPLNSLQVRKADLGKSGIQTSGNPDSGHGEVRNPDVAKASSEIPEMTAEKGGMLTHEGEEANGLDADNPVNGNTDGAYLPADEPDWEDAWKRRYDREVTRPLTRPPRAHTLAPPPPDPEAAVHTLAAGLAAKATMLVEDVEARRTRLRAQSQWLMANGY